MADTELQILITAVDEASAMLQNVQNQLASLRGESRGAGQQMMEFGDRLTQIGQGFDQSFGQPARQALMASVGGAMAFESAMSDVSKVLGLGEEETAAMGQQLIAMSRTLPVSAEGLASIAASGGALGIPAESIDEFVQLTGQMGTAFDMSADQAGDSIARMINVFSLMDPNGNPDLQGVAQLGDVINAISDSSSANASEIVNAMTRVGGVTRQFGLASEEAAALTGAFISMGRPPEVAATAINSMLPALQTATSGTETFQEGLAMIGLSAEQMEAAVQDNAVGALEMLFENLGQLEAGDRATAIRNMFGTGSDAAIIASLAEDSSVLAKSLETARTAMESPENTMLMEFDKRSATTANALQILQNSFKELGMSVGVALLPAIQAVAQAIAPLVQGLSDFVAQNPLVGQIAVAFLAIVAAIGPVLIAVGSLVGAFGAIVTAFGAGGALAGVGAALAAAVSGPVLLVVGLVVAAAALIIANWENVKTFFAGFASGFMATVGPAFQSLWMAVQQLGAALAPMLQFFVALFPATTQASAGVNSFGMALGMLVGWVVNTITFLVQIQVQILAFAQNVVNTVVGITMAIVSGGATILATILGIVGSILGTIGSIVGAVMGAVSSVVGAIMSGVSQAVGAVQSMGGQMLAAVGAIASQMFQAGVNIVTSIAQGIQSAVGQVMSAISSVASAVRGALPFSPPEYGPLSDIMSVGGNIVGSIASGINPGPITSAMNSALAPAAGMMGGLGIGAPTGGVGIGGGGGGLTVNLTVNSAGGNGQQVGADIVQVLRMELPRLMAEMERNKARVSYG